MTTEDKVKKLNDRLPDFSGSMEFYKYLGNCLLTEGTKFLAETIDCYWFMDVIASYQGGPKLRGEDFQVWTMEADLVKGSGKVTCTDGNDNVLITQVIPCTDFPLAKFSVWAERNETGGFTILLPSEH